MHARLEEIRKEIVRGRQSLQAAEQLLESDLLADALSRSYYAVLHAARAVLVYEDIEVVSHEALKRQFGLCLVKSGKIDSKYARILRQEQDDRMLAEYDVSFDPEAAQVRRRIADANDFLDAMMSFLLEKGIVLE